MNMRQIYAIKTAREKQINELCPTITSDSGIYVFFREDENGIKHCYVGQAKHLLERVAAHLSEYDHIGLSLKKRGLYSPDNPFGWQLGFKECDVSDLDKNEQKTILHYAKKGYQLYNATFGGQGKGKTGIDGKYKSGKTYRQGLSQGYLNARKDIANLFKKHLKYDKKSEKPNKNQEKALKKFEDFINISEQRGDEQSEIFDRNK